MLNILKSLFLEYRIGWSVSRILYAVKLRLLKLIPAVAILFEKTVDIQRIDIFSIDVPALEGFLKALPLEKRKEIIEAADNAAVGCIKSFHSIHLGYGNPIDWQLNPITGGRADIHKRWYEIPDFDKQRGDIKVIWEPSRLTHFFDFARAYLLTGNANYYNAFSSQLAHWLRSNPYPYGANFKCGQECALRMLSVLLTAPVFKDAMTKQDKENLMQLVALCYKKIQSNFFYAHKCIRNNHTLSEITGLIAGAWCCGEDKKLRKAYRLLEAEIRRQFTTDGGYIQHSFNYQRLALQIFEAVLKMGDRTGLSLSDGAKKTLEGSVLLLYQMQQESGLLPNYGPNDGAHIFPLSVCGYRDFRPCLNTLYQRLTGSRLYHKSEYDEELYWFGNPTAPVARIGRESTAFHDAGLYSIRSKSIFAMLICQNYHYRPAHFDQLHLDLWYNDINVFSDSGTYSYASELGSLFSTTAGHNTVIADGREQMNKKGAFFVYNWTKRTHANHDSNTFFGAFQSQNGYTHKRAVKLSDTMCEIVDKVTDANTIEKLFYTPCDIKIVDNGYELIYNNDHICTLFSSGNVSIDRAKQSCYYMKYDEVNLIKIKTLSSDTQAITIKFQTKSEKKH